MYVCIYVQFAQIKLVQLTTLYNYELRAVCRNHHVRSLGLRALLARSTVWDLA